jgi:hypothetical protein
MPNTRAQLVVFLESLLAVTAFKGPESENPRDYFTGTKARQLVAPLAHSGSAGEQDLRSLRRRRSQIDEG